MSGFEIKFNVYANSQEEADKATEAIKAFINAKALQGVAVTANKIADAVSRYKDNYFVTNFFKN
jgi:hypothetical protein